jgi:pimeloyl-ACP methyl ester carboxylesterase
VRCFSFVLVMVGLLLSACTRSDRPTALDRLHPCATGEGPTDAYCGTYQVFENRDTRQGRTIDLRIIVLPALSNEPQPDPVFFLAGGPGQGAAAMARQIREMFRRVQADRDIVLVDQRGTGKSHPLECKSDEDSLAVLNESTEQGLERLRQCLKGLDADVRLYTTSIAMADLNDVRAYLGYDKINLYGGSYGTRAALVYLREHESTVRAVVLDGVAPPDMRLPLFMARDGQRALDRLVADCEVDEVCRSRHPRLGERLRTLIAALDASPVSTQLTHPRSGVTEEVRIDGEFVANVIFGALYSPLISSLLPELVARAERRDFQGLLALTAMSDSAASNMSVGMQMSVVCAEDYPRIAPEQVEREAAGTVFATHLLHARMRACEFWPKGTVEPTYYEPVRSQVPVLVLSGELDPVTPPPWGEAVLPHLPNAKHVVAPGTGHGVIGTGCGMRLVHAFLTAGTVAGLDTSCVETLRRPPFFLTPAGPDPAGSARGTS